MAVARLSTPRFIFRRSLTCPWPSHPLVFPTFTEVRCSTSRTIGITLLLPILLTTTQLVLSLNLSRWAYLGLHPTLQSHREWHTDPSTGHRTSDISINQIIASISAVVLPVREGHSDSPTRHRTADININHLARGVPKLIFEPIIILKYFTVVLNVSLV